MKAPVAVKDYEKRLFSAVLVVACRGYLGTILDLLFICLFGVGL